MQYQEYDLKTEQTVISQEDQTITTIPSREDSLERLAEQEVQFAGEAESVEETVLWKLQYEQLHKALSLLPDDERELIDRLFFQGQTEREAAECMGIYRNAVHKRKNRILKKLKKFHLCGWDMKNNIIRDGSKDGLEVLEDIGREALKVLEEERKGEAEHGDKAGADRNPQETGEGAENGESGEAGSAENEEAGEQAKASAAGEPGMEENVPLDISRKYSGLAYGSCRVYRFSVYENTLNAEFLEEGTWKKEEELSDFQWDGKCFAKGEYDKILAEEYNGNIYYIRWGEAFCQKNSGYPAPGTLWPGLVGTCFTAEGEDAVKQVPTGTTAI